MKHNIIKAALILTCLSLPALIGCDSGSSTPVKVEISIAEMQFTPQEVTVHAGDTIVWKNNDLFAHNVSDTIHQIASGTLEPGESWQWIATESIDYFCSLHPTMTASVKVKK